jgi:GNAT superfamily N-acetyltransferase
VGHHKLDFVYLRGAGGFWLAWDEDLPVGHIGAQDLGGVVELRRMYVRPEYRRRGVGSLLVQALIGYCAARGVAAIELWTGADDLGRKLYEKHRFQVVEGPGPGFEEVVERTGYVPGEDEVRMRREL